jgi:ornithine carbamoyltransferase
MTPVMTQIATVDKLSVSDLISDVDMSRDDIRTIFRVAEHMKSAPQQYARALEGQQLAMIFEKPSLRTRVTFEVGMNSMGGRAIYLEHSKPRLGERETIKDVARNLERWVQGIVARTFSHRSVAELAENACIPVINGLSDLVHPCQALADYFTLQEKFGRLSGLQFAYIGDGNNMCNSLMVQAAKLGVRMRVATPAGYEPDAEFLNHARQLARQTHGSIEVMRDPIQAACGAHAIYTDVWTSMGQEHAAHLRSQVFLPYQVNDAVLAAADPGAVFMHCLPAHRGQEVTNSVIDSTHSVVYDQAENRLHVQKALLLLLLQSERA